MAKHKKQIFYSCRLLCYNVYKKNCRHCKGGTQGDKMTKLIENQRFGQERALYNTNHACVRNCRFEGEEDGESALKQCNDVAVQNCFFDLRYPMWHVQGLKVRQCTLTENCRAAMWYDCNVELADSTLDGIKALRECSDISLNNCTAHSPEFGWRCNGVRIHNSVVESQYGFFESSNIYAEKLQFSGKYSFQYTQNVTMANCTLAAKDGFWHAKNVTVFDSVIDGEYLAWYSENLTLVRCHIKGTQPFCYCKNLKLVDCTMEGCDLAFEYSQVEANILSHVDSIKNPAEGRIVAQSVGQVLRTEDSVYPSNAEVVQTLNPRT